MAHEILTFYRFQSESDPQARADKLLEPARELGLLGTVLTAPEGWNCSFWGESAVLDAYLARLDLIPEICVQPSEVRRMVLEKQPFRKLIARVKPEIIKFGIPVDVREGVGTHISAEELHALLRDRPGDVLMLDVRNRYEKDIGTFDGAVDPGIENFHELPDAMLRMNLPADKTIVTFCTGGIRCEKVVPFLKSKGLQNVFQIDGGIWRYIARYPDGFFKGECFWFDERRQL